MEDSPATRPSGVGDLLDLEELRRLAAAYVACIDKGWRPDTFDPDGLDDVFVTDATYEMTGVATTVESLDAIKADLIAETRELAFSHHSLTDPVIVIDGDEATSRWKMWIVARREGGSLQSGLRRVAKLRAAGHDLDAAALSVAACSSG